MGMAPNLGLQPFQTIGATSVKWEMGWTATNKWHGDLWFTPGLGLEPLKVAIHLLRKKNRHGNRVIWGEIMERGRPLLAQRPLHVQFWNINWPKYTHQSVLGGPPRLIEEGVVAGNPATERSHLNSLGPWHPWSEAGGMIPKVTCCLSAIKDGALDPKSALRGQLKFGSWGWPASNLRADHRTLNFVYIYIYVYIHTHRFCIPTGVPVSRLSVNHSISHVGSSNAYIVKSCKNIFFVAHMPIYFWFFC